MLSFDYNHYIRICYTAMLMVGQTVREEVCYAEHRQALGILHGQAPLSIRKMHAHCFVHRMDENGILA